MARTPDFLVIGDHKTGTTSINEYLKQHPEVFTPLKIKELRYFAFDASNPYHQTAPAYRVKTYEDYLGYFAEATTERVVGEASPNYLRSFGAAERIHERFPNVKLIIGLRNPADRLFSLYQMEARKRKDPVSFEEEVFSRNAAWIKGNFYYPDLARYFELFPRENIYVVLFEDLLADQTGEMQKLYRYLGVDPTFVPTKEVFNKGGRPKSGTWYRFLMKLRQIVKALGLNSGFLKKFGKQMINDTLVKESISPQTRQKVLEITRDDTLKTQELIGRDLSAWLPED